MQQEFTYTVRLPTVDPPVYEAFHAMLDSSQANMRRVIAEYNKLRERVARLSDENDQLRAQNLRLQQELAASRRGPASNGTGITEVPEGSPFVLERTIKIHDAPVHSVAVARGGDLVATASWDSHAKLYSLQQNDVVRTLGDDDKGSRQEAKMGGLYSVAFAKTAPDVLGCTSCDKFVYLWNHKTGKLMSKLAGHTDEVNGIDFHSSQQVMCSASDDCKVIVWDFQEGLTLRTLDKHGKQVYGATFLGQDLQYFVATCCFDQKTRVFDMRDKQVVAMMQGHSDDIIGIDFSSPRGLLATGSDDGQICLWDSKTWKMLHKINTKDCPAFAENEVKRLAFSPDGNQLAAACSSGSVLVYDVGQGIPHQVARLGGHTDCVFDVAWAENAATGVMMLVSASHDHSCRCWRKV